MPYIIHINVAKIILFFQSNFFIVVFGILLITNVIHFIKKGLANYINNFFL